MTFGAKLQWVLDENSNIRNVSEFSNTPANKRPKVICPECDSDVILRLGHRRVHHAAHKSGDYCSSTNSETALHINAKFHLADVLKQGSTLNIRRQCKNFQHGTRCTGAKECQWEPVWSTVKVEYKIGTKRPDILLFHNEMPVGAIEVFVTHKVDANKASAFRDLAIQWIEVSGHNILPSSGDPWSLSCLLPIYNEGGHIPYECPNCLENRLQNEKRHELERQAEEQRTKFNEQRYEAKADTKPLAISQDAEQYKPADQNRTKSGKIIRAYRFVDHFFKSGKRIRELYILFEICESGNVIRYGYTSTEGCSKIIEGPISKIGRSLISTNFKTDVQRFPDAVSIPHRRWVPKKEWMESPEQTFSTAAYPPQLEWDSYRSKWIGIKDEDVFKKA